MLERVGISLDGDLLRLFDGFIEEKGYANRSEAVRALIREKLIERRWAAADEGEAVAVVTLVYDHESSALSQKLTHLQHQDHRAVVSALHIHLDAHNCLEVLVLRGPPGQVLELGEGLVSTRGVKFGRVVPATTGDGLP